VLKKLIFVSTSVVTKAKLEKFINITDWRISNTLQASTSSAAAKKAGLDPSASGNYRLISNLGIISDVLERLVLARLHRHVLDSRNSSQFQSAYRKQNSTKTALLEAFDSVYAAADDKQVTVLVGLDLSATFDTVSRDTLLQRL